MKVLINELWKIPFLRFLSPFILGIIAGNYFTLKIEWSLALTLLFFGLSLVYRPFFSNDVNYHRRWIFGILISSSLFCISFYLTVSYNATDNEIEAADIVLGTVDEPPKETAKSIKIILQTEEFERDGLWIKNKSKILVYLEKDSFSNNINYGDVLLLNANLRCINNAGNPHEFDYKKYLQRNQIHFQSYQNSKQWIKLASNRGNFLYEFAYSIRGKIIDIYKKAGISGDEFAILSALTLGVKDYLSDEIVNSYSHSGAMHVLAVSGLHVGIITMMLNFLLSAFRKKAKLRIIHTVVVISFLWIFAVMTGLTPSVTRSALMFTFFITASNSERKPNSFNSLAASAFVILSVNPNALFHVGFQLSFLAVASILFFQPRISGLFTINNFIGNQIWQLTSVSIAAQIGTTPISIYYFHQFPVYALITNIVVVPAAMLIMYLTVVLLLACFWSVIANVVGTVLTFVINLLNKSTQIIENLPFSGIEFISLSPIELVISYLIIVLVAIIFILKAKEILFIVLTLLISIFVIRDYRYFDRLKNCEFIVFNTNKSSAIANINGLKMTLYADTSLINNENNLKYLCSNIRTECAINNFRAIKLSADSTNVFPVKFINANKIKIAYLSDKIDRFQSHKKMQVDYVVLSKNSTINIESINSLFKFDSIILDSSMPKWKQNVVEKECISRGINCFNISKQGAFISKAGYKNP